METMTSCQSSEHKAAPGHGPDDYVDMSRTYKSITNRLASLHATSQRRDGYFPKLWCQSCGAKLGRGHCTMSSWRGDQWTRLCSRSWEALVTQDAAFRQGSSLEKVFLLVTLISSTRHVNTSRSVVCVLRRCFSKGKNITDMTYQHINICTMCLGKAVPRGPASLMRTIAVSRMRQV